MPDTTLPAGGALDALVAERVMGHTMARHVHPALRRDGAAHVLVHEGVAAPCPRYSTDLVAAWLVVDRMRADGLRPVLMPDWGQQWQVIVYRRSEYVAESEWCDTVPLAICRAALAAREVR